MRRWPIPLGKLDTPANRRLLELLIEAQTVAEQVDRERGFPAPDFWAEQPAQVDQPELPRGIDLALSVWLLRTRVELEVNGPQTGRE